MASSGRIAGDCGAAGGGRCNRPTSVADYVKSGLIVRVPGPEGLCYLNEARYLRRRVWGWVALGAIGAAMTAFAVFVLW